VQPECDLLGGSDVGGSGSELRCSQNVICWGGSDVGGSGSELRCSQMEQNSKICC